MARATPNDGAQQQRGRWRRRGPGYLSPPTLLAGAICSASDSKWAWLTFNHFKVMSLAQHAKFDPQMKAPLVAANLRPDLRPQRLKPATVQLIQCWHEPPINDLLPNKVLVAFEVRSTTAATGNKANAATQRTIEHSGSLAVVRDDPAAFWTCAVDTSVGFLFRHYFCEPNDLSSATADEWRGLCRSAAEHRP